MSVAQVPPIPELMRAVRIEAFGGVGQMVLQSVPVPMPGPGEVLVALSAAGVGPWDALVREGRSGLGQVPPLTLGSDGTGVVVATGADVEDVQRGDCVFGATNDSFVGAYAEFALFDAARVALKPTEIGFIEAGGVPIVGATAWAMLHDYGSVQAGQRVLVHGAAGAVGNLAVQLARHAGAEVVATCRATDMAFVAGLGAQEVIDVESSDFVREVRKVDLVVDTVGGDKLRRSYDVLPPGGVLVSIVEPPDAELAAERSVRAQFFIVDVRAPILARLGELMAAGALRANVGEVLPLSEARLAHEMLAGRRHRRGKIVLDVNGPAARRAGLEAW